MSFYNSGMCGRFTKNYTWQQIQVLSPNRSGGDSQYAAELQRQPDGPRGYRCRGSRELVQMCWGLVPYWWNKPPKELRLATFNARIETVTTKPLFREPFKHTRRLIPVSGYYEWQDTPNGKHPGTSLHEAARRY
jgi:putative SOS response-associated peptidase YedK